MAGSGFGNRVGTRKKATGRGAELSAPTAYYGYGGARRGCRIGGTKDSFLIRRGQPHPAGGRIRDTPFNRRIIMNPSSLPTQQARLIRKRITRTRQRFLSSRASDRRRRRRSRSVASVRLFLVSERRKEGERNGGGVRTS